jgi:hypothetical protein
MAQASRSSGRRWKITGVALMVLGSVSGVSIGGPAEIILMNSKFLHAIASILPAALLFSGAFLYWRGRQYAALASAESVITDAKQHLLYLRPFRSDYTMTKGLFRQFETTEEEQLADVLRPFGELVAIGRPGESLPTPGAARIYTSDEEWRDVVRTSDAGKSTGRDQSRRWRKRALGADASCEDFRAAKAADPDPENESARL